jgi:hypothetical protein
MNKTLIYPGFTDICGWMSEAELRWLYDTAQKMSSIVELGSWQGRSTHALLSGCRGLVYAIDLWEDFNKAGIQDIDAFQAFQQNLKGFDNLFVIRMDTITAAKSFTEKVDMVFVDATHTYEAVKAEIQVWLPRAAKMICGHDYHPIYFPEVYRAVNEMFDSVGTHDTIWFKEL